MNGLTEYIPFLIPVVVIQFGLAITALIHVLRHPNYRIGNKAVWVLVVLLIGIIGPVCYFTFGKGDE